MEMDDDAKRLKPIHHQYDLIALISWLITRSVTDNDYEMSHLHSWIESNPERIII